MKKLRRIISMLMVLVLFIGILPMNLGVVKAEAELDDTTKLNNIKVRAYNSETEIWDDIGLTIKEYVGSKQDTIYTPIEFDPGRRLYQIKLDPKYKKIQFYIEKAYEKQVVEIESGFAYKVRNSNYTEETALEAGKNSFKFYVKPSNGSATREHVFSVERGDVTKDRTKIHKLNVTDGSAEFYEAYEGDIISVCAIRDIYKVFDRWVIEDGNIIEIEDGNSIIKEPDKTPTELIMPNTILTIKPTFKESIVNDSNLRDIVLYGLEDEVWKNQKSKLAFKKEQKAYTVDLSDDFSIAYLYFQFGDSKQSISVTLNNNVVASSKAYMPNGYETEKIKLNEEENTFKITVTSQDGTNTSVYTLIVNKGNVKYKVSLVPGEGKGENIVKDFAKGSTYTLPECDFTAPEGQVFKAWSVNDTEKAVGDEITVDKDTEVIALWKDIMFKVSLVPGEGKGENIVKDFAKGSTYTLPKCTFEAPENKEFAGWKIGEEIKDPGQEITIDKETLITATWKDVMVSVSFNPGDGKGSMDAEELVKGSKYNLPECKFEAPDGQVFKAWSVNDIEKAVGDEIIVNKDTEVIALWKDIMFKVSLVPGEGTGENIVKDFAKGSTYTLPDCTFEAPEGQVFKAWKIGDKEYDPQTTIRIDEETEIKAIWQENPDKPNPDKPKPSEKHAINITPSPCGEVIIVPLEAKAGDKVTVRAIAKYGYELVGLSVHDASGKLLPITNGEFIMPDGEVDIYPIFREIAPYIDPEIDDKDEREEQKRRARRDYYHEEENNEDEVKTIDKAKEEKEKESKVIISIGDKKLDKINNGVHTVLNMDTKPYIKGGRTMLPLRYVAEALGYRVAWLSETRTAVIMDIGLRVEIPVDSNFIIVNGVKYTSDVKPEMRKNRIMLPIANIARSLGLKDGEDILWDEVNRQVTLIRNFNTK
ncbi:stalk domain-containing protein [Fenollaria sp.]|uniref:stalk domain-containing protein n=1 Tax=Fenollaria sp. TaxID=1965292 RepID=UPI002A761CBE|nr:stalk domain-containing protein [Fenollaria sp.]MDY3105375.1 stalk domain-containing protein [Fenollaria sp.]